MKVYLRLLFCIEIENADRETFDRNRLNLFYKNDKTNVLYS